MLSCEQAAAAYASRWQMETCFNELETSIRGGAAVVLRSKSPPMIRQEIYAMLCCYQAIRVLISDAAGDAGIDPGGSPSPSRARGSGAASATRDPFPLRNLTRPSATWPSRSPASGTWSASGPAAATSGNQTARRTVQDPQARRDQPADPADQYYSHGFTS